MTVSPVTSSVLPAALVADYSTDVTHTASETQATGHDIGNLNEQGVILTVRDHGVAVDAPTTATFILESNDRIFLGLSFDNIVDAAITRVQLFNSDDEIIADNQGTEAQQNAYVTLLASGLQPGAGEYTVQISSPLGGVTIDNLPQQGSSLDVTSKLTSAVTQEVYNFSLSGNNLKLAFDAGVNDANARVQLLDSTGAIIADSQGSAAFASNYADLNSASGLEVESGDYSVVVSYDPANLANADLAYNFQLYSGNRYSIVYHTTGTATPGDNSVTSSVTEADDTENFGRNDFHKLKEDFLSAINVGWLKQNESTLSVFSRLTSLNNAQYYTFILQQGENLKLNFNNTTSKGAVDLRVQLYDGSGTQLLADNFGTAAQQAAYKSLNSATGLTTKANPYIVKVTYAPNAVKTADQDYNFQIFSGTSYSAIYKTTVAPQGFRNAIISGQIGSGFNAVLAAATYLAAGSDSSSGLIDPFGSNGTSPDLMAALSLKV